MCLTQHYLGLPVLRESKGSVSGLSSSHLDMLEAILDIGATKKGCRNLKTDGVCCCMFLSGVLREKKHQYLVPR